MITAEEAEETAFQARVGQIMERYNEEVEEARVKRDIALCILYSGITTKNFTYYDTSNRLVFNWVGYGELLSQEEFDRFVAEADYSLLPKGIKIELGKQGA